MRALTTLFIAVSLALTANARTIGKREISPPVNECVSLVNGLKVSFDSLNATFASYSDPSQEPALSKTKEEREKYFTDSLKLGNEIMTAQEKCCAAPINFAAKEDSKAISDAFANYSMSADKAYTTLGSKESELSKTPTDRDNIIDILGAFQPTEMLNKCLIERSPEAENQDNDYVFVKVSESMSELDNVAVIFGLSSAARMPYNRN